MLKILFYLFIYFNTFMNKKFYEIKINARIIKNIIIMNCQRKNFLLKFLMKLQYIENEKRHGIYIIIHTENNLKCI